MKGHIEIKQGQEVGRMKLIIWLNSLGGILALLAVLSLFSYQAGPLGWDKPFIHWYQSAFDVNVWEKAMKAVSWVGGDVQWGLLTILLAFAWLIMRRRPAAALTLSSVIAFGANSIVKTLVERPRPSPAAISVLEVEGGNSFPSGHVATYTALFGITFFLVTRYVNNLWLKRVLQASLAAIVVLVGPSRMTLGVHWPSDVGGGYLVGMIYLLIAIPLFVAVSRRGQTKGHQS